MSRFDFTYSWEYPKDDYGKVYKELKITNNLNNKTIYLKYPNSDEYLEKTASKEFENLVLNAIGAEYTFEEFKDELKEYGNDNLVKIYTECVEDNELLRTMYDGDLRELLEYLRG